MWYVMQVRTGMEAQICEKCRSRIIKEEEEAFIPLAERQTKIHGERQLVRTRMFPGYVFIETDRIDDFYRRLKGAEIMARVLCTGEFMTPLQEAEEVFLRKLCGRDHVAHYSEGYMEGDRLTVVSGALKGFQGKVKKVLRHKRLVVLEVLLLGRTMEVTLGLGVLEKK